MSVRAVALNLKKKVKAHYVAHSFQPAEWSERLTWVCGRAGWALSPEVQFPLFLHFLLSLSLSLSLLSLFQGQFSPFA